MMPLEHSVCTDETPVVVLVAVGRISDQAILVQKMDKSTASEELEAFEDGLYKVMRQASALPAQPCWRERLEVSSDEESNGNGYVYALADAQALCVVAIGLRSQLCPERVAQELLEGLVKKVRVLETERRLIKAKPGALSSKTKRMLNEVIKSYRDPDKVSNVMQVHEKFDQFKSLMNDNVKRILEKHLTIETLQTQSQSMGASADQFLSESICKRRHGGVRSWRAKAAVGGSIFIVAAVLLLHMVVR